jgi:hypothetical protein
MALDPRKGFPRSVQLSAAAAYPDKQDRRPLRGRRSSHFEADPGGVLRAEWESCLPGRPRPEGGKEASSSYERDIGLT